MQKKNTVLPIVATAVVAVMAVAIAGVLGFSAFKKSNEDPTTTTKPTEGTYFLTKQQLPQ